MIVGAMSLAEGCTTRGAFNFRAACGLKLLYKRLPKIPLKGEYFSQKVCFLSPLMIVSNSGKYAVLILIR